MGFVSRRRSKFPNRPEVIETAELFLRGELFNNPPITDGPALYSNIKHFQGGVNTIIFLLYIILSLCFLFIGRGIIHTTIPLDRNTFFFP